MSNKRIIPGILACLLLLIVVLTIVFHEQILHWALDNYFSQLEHRTEYPDSGKYYCDELDATIDCSFRVPILHLAGQEYALHVLGYDATFNGISGNDATPMCRMPYLWDREKDEILITITQFPVDYEEGKMYYFRRIE